MPTALSNIACLDFAEGRVDDAKKLLDEVIEIVKALPPQHQQQPVRRLQLLPLLHHQLWPPSLHPALPRRELSLQAAQHQLERFV